MGEIALEAIESVNAAGGSQQLIKTLAIINYLKATVFILIGAVMRKKLNFILHLITIAKCSVATIPATIRQV